MSASTTAILSPGPQGAELAPGWHRDLPMTDYLSVRAMSASGLETFRRSPMHYKWRSETPPEDTTAALARGSALHLALLEPDLFEAQVVKAGSCEALYKSGARKGEPCGSATASRDFMGRWACGRHGGENPVDGALPADEFETVLAMRDAVLAHPRASSILAGAGETEITGVWEEPETGVLCKIRPDRLVHRASILPDLKSTRDASPDFFFRQAETLGYWRKAAFYRRGCAALGKPLTASALIAVESAEPFGVAVYLLDEDHLRAADEEVGRLLRRFAMCATDDHWPGYGDEFQTLRRPAWALSQETDDE